MIECLLEPIKVEIISDVFFIDFAEKLMILKVTKPPNPSFTFFRTVFRAIRHIAYDDFDLRL